MNMFKKVVFTTSIIVIITGVAITANLVAEPSKNGQITTQTQESLVNSTTVDSELSTPKNSEWDPDISPQVDSNTLRFIGTIATKHGDFVRQDKQIIFNESEIARQLRQIGPTTKQLILHYGIFLRTDIK